MKNYTVILKHDFTEALLQIVTQALEEVFPGPDDDRLFLAALSEIKIRLAKKLIEFRSEYSIGFTPVQAMALRILYTDVFQTDNKYTENRFRQIADEIHRHYS
jgi:hypothetical protein